MEGVDLLAIVALHGAALKQRHHLMQPKPLIRQGTGGQAHRSRGNHLMRLSRAGNAGAKLSRRHRHDAVWAPTRRRRRCRCARRVASHLLLSGGSAAFAAGRWLVVGTFAQSRTRICSHLRPVAHVYLHLKKASAASSPHLAPPSCTHTTVCLALHHQSWERRQQDVTRLVVARPSTVTRTSAPRCVYTLRNA